MIITLFAQENGWEIPVIKVLGDVLYINNIELDFSVIEEGYTLPVSYIDCKWFTPGTDVYRKNGQLYMTLLFPVTPLSSYNMRNPKPIVVTKDGIVDLPKDETVVVTPGVENSKIAMEDSDVVN